MLVNPRADFGWEMSEGEEGRMRGSVIPSVFVVSEEFSSIQRSKAVKTPGIPCSGGCKTASQRLSGGERASRRRRQVGRGEGQATPGSKALELDLPAIFKWLVRRRDQLCDDQRLDEVCSATGME